jgi:hypothetical protein
VAERIPAVAFIGMMGATYIRRRRRTRERLSDRQSEIDFCSRLAATAFDETPFPFGDFMTPFLLYLLAVFFIIAGVVLLWLNLREWHRRKVIVTPEEHDGFRDEFRN